MNQQQFGNLSTSWLNFIGSIVHDARTPLSSISLFSNSLAEMLPHLVKGYRLAVEHQLMEETIDNWQLMQLEEDEFDSVDTDVARLMNFFTKAYDFTKILTDLSKIKTFSFRKWLTHSLEEYPFKKDTIRTLIHAPIDEDFNFKYFPIFSDRLCHTILEIVLNNIELNKKGELYLSIEKKEGYHLLHFKCTSGSMSSHSLNTCFSQFFTEKCGKKPNEEKHHLLPGIGFCKLALAQLSGDLTVNFVDNEYIDFIIKFPPAD